MEEVKKKFCYCTNLRRSSNAITGIYDDALKETGLSVSQYSLLINLFRMGNANISQWASRVGLDRSTMIRNIKVLDAHGWIVRTSGQGKQYTLSEKGNQVLQSAIPIWEQTQRIIEEEIGIEDIEAVLRFNQKIQELSMKIGK